MTQENKELLLKDLCARLPYGVKCKDWDYGENDEKVNTIEELETIFPKTHRYKYLDISAEHDIGRIKPYLRPLSSITEVEKQIYETMSRNHTPIQAGNYVDWLNRKMFDYRGLIEKGLALEAPEGMYEK